MILSAFLKLCHILNVVDILGKYDRIEETE